MPKNFLPVCLNLKFYKVLIVGGGKAALQKLKTLLSCGCQVTVIAQEAAEGIQTLARQRKISLIQRGFKNSDLKGYNLIYACTNDKALNKKIAGLAQKRAILWNVASDPRLSNFISPAVYNGKDLMVAVSTFGRNPKQAVDWRNRLGHLIELCTTNGNRSRKTKRNIDYRHIIG